MPLPAEGCAAVVAQRQLNSAICNRRSSAPTQCLNAVDCESELFGCDRAPRLPCETELELVCRNTSTATATTAALSSKHTLASADVVFARHGESRPSAAAEPSTPIPLAPSTGRAAPSPSRRPGGAGEGLLASSSRAPLLGYSINFLWAARARKTRATLPRGSPQRRKRAISTAKRWTPTSTAPSMRPRRPCRFDGPMYDGAR